MKAQWEAVGEIYNNDHPSTPIVIGDLETVQASWSSDHEDHPPEGLVVPDLGSRAPVLLTHGDELWLLAENHDYAHLDESFTFDELVTVASAPENDIVTRHVIPVRSGRLAIALALIDGSDLPAASQRMTDVAVMTASDDEYTKALVVAPVPPGTYEVTVFEALDVGIRKPKYEDDPAQDRRLFVRARVRLAAE